MWIFEIALNSITTYKQQIILSATGFVITYVFHKSL